VLNPVSKEVLIHRLAEPTLDRYIGRSSQALYLLSKSADKSIKAMYDLAANQI